MPTKKDLLQNKLKVSKFKAREVFLPGSLTVLPSQSRNASTSIQATMLSAKPAKPQMLVSPILALVIPFPRTSLTWLQPLLVLIIQPPPAMEVALAIKDNRCRAVSVAILAPLDSRVEVRPRKAVSCSRVPARMRRRQPPRQPLLRNVTRRRNPKNSALARRLLAKVFLFADSYQLCLGPHFDQYVISPRHSVVYNINWAWCYQFFLSDLMLHDSENYPAVCPSGLGSYLFARVFIGNVYCRADRVKWKSKRQMGSEEPVFHPAAGTLWVNFYAPTRFTRPSDGDECNLLKTTANISGSIPKLATGIAPESKPEIQK